MTDFEISQALKIIDQTLPVKLNKVQKLVLRECWQGKTYQEIARGSDYEPDYIRVVGSRLWQNLSTSFRQKINKNNFKTILQQKAKTKFAGSSLKFPDGQVPLDSEFYIERPPVEVQAYEKILDPGAMIVIRSASNMGKTSLMIRILAQARSQGYHAVTLNLQLAEASVLSDLDKFLRWLMANITLQLGISSKLDQYWDRDLGTKISCTNYFQHYILAELSQPLVLAFDEINYLFDYPQIAQEFIPLIRFWHEEAANLKIWQCLRIIMVQSTALYTSLDLNHSPFNLGLPLTLTEFSLQQIRELASRHQFQLKVADLEQNLIFLQEMVGGYPYLIRLAFYVLSTQKITFQQLLTEAPTPNGIYRIHLQDLCAKVNNYPELVAAFNQVVMADVPVQISCIAAYKLESMGLIKFLGNKVTPSCQLYRLYFRDYIAA